MFVKGENYVAERAERIFDKLKSMIGIGSYDYGDDEEADEPELEEREQEEIPLKAVGASGGGYAGTVGAPAEPVSARSGSTQGSGSYNSYRRASSSSGYGGGAAAGGIPNNTIPFPKQDSAVPRYSHDTQRRQPVMSSMASMSSAASVTEPKRRFSVLTFAPKHYKDCAPLIDHLKRDTVVIVSFEKLESSEARRIFEFLNGATYALGGKSQKISNKTFMFGSREVDFKTQLDEGKSLSFDTTFRS